ESDRAAVLIRRANRPARRRLRRRPRDYRERRPGAARPHGGAGRREAHVIAQLARFLALPAAERGRTLEATFDLLVVRASLGLLPLPRALRLFGIVRGEAGSGRDAPAEAQAVGRAVARAARHVPFRAACLQQAFAALLMLRRRGLRATVHLGLARG